MGEGVLSPVLPGPDLSGRSRAGRFSLAQTCLVAPGRAVSPDHSYGGYALDAIDWYDPQNVGKSHKSDVMAFLKDSLSAVPETRPAVGSGTDLRLSSEKVTGFALLLGDNILHLSIFARSGVNNRSKEISGGRMSRFSSRVRNRT